MLKTELVKEQEGEEEGNNMDKDKKKQIGFVRVNSYIRCPPTKMNPSSLPRSESDFRKQLERVGKNYEKERQAFVRDFNRTLKGFNYGRRKKD